MVRRPTFFLIALPSLFAIFIGVGWGTVDDKVEDAVVNIWTQQRSDYAKDRAYVRSLSDSESATAAGIGTTTFAGLAATRDGGNLFTEDRITEILERMKATEATTVSLSLSLSIYIYMCWWLFDNVFGGRVISTLSFSVLEIRMELQLATQNRPITSHYDVP
jgi:hypothetical protein